MDTHAHAHAHALALVCAHTHAHLSHNHTHTLTHNLHGQGVDRIVFEQLEFCFRIGVVKRCFVIHCLLMGVAVAVYVLTVLVFACMTDVRFIIKSRPTKFGERHPNRQIFKKFHTLSASETQSCIPLRVVNCSRLCSLLRQTCAVDSYRTVRLAPCMTSAIRRCTTL